MNRLWMEWRDFFCRILLLILRCERGNLTLIHRLNHLNFFHFTFSLCLRFLFPMIFVLAFLGLSSLWLSNFVTPSSVFEHFDKWPLASWAIGFVPLQCESILLLFSQMISLNLAPLILLHSKQHTNECMNGRMIKPWLARLIPIPQTT